jgi:hypothetical protein
MRIEMNKPLSIALLSWALLFAAGNVQAKQYVFPENGQSPETQSQDEYSCHSWATNETGFDPTEPQPVPTAATPAPQAEQGASAGSGVRGAARGAVAGAVIGEVSDGDSSDAAATGAALGVVAGRRRSRQANADAAQQQQQAQADSMNQQAAVNNAQVEEYYKARSVCLEAKGYSVK